MALLDEVKVKLGVPKEGGAILFRRIDLSRYGDNLGDNGGGKAIYKKLKLLAVQSATSSHDMPPASALNSYQVTLHYTDTDGDECMIGSVAELKDSLRMYSDKGYVKIVADVYKKQEQQHSKATTTTESVESSTQTGSSGGAEDEEEEEEGDVEVPPIPSVSTAPAATTSSRRVHHPHPVQLQNVVDTIVGAIGPAINSIRLVAAEAEQKAAEAASRASFVHENKSRSCSEEKNNNNKPSPVPAAAAASATATAKEPEDEPKANNDSKIEEPKTKAAPRPPAAAADSAPGADKPSSPPPSQQKLKPAVPTTVTAEEKAEEKQRPFIHGRHTCDGCLTTPIVGNRWHAINLPDYDLCNKCKTNYKGNEIKFEKVILERDEPFQERWNRRRAKWVARNGGGGGGGRRHHRYPHQQRVCTRGMRPRRTWGQPPAPYAGPKPEEVDSALKEAIRRSLQDYKAAPASEEEKKKTEPAKEEEEAPEVKDDEPANKKDEKEVTENSTAQKSVSADEEKQPEVPKVVDTTIPVNGKKKAPAYAEETTVDEEDDKKPPASAAKNPPRSTANSSFESEAEGIGSVAGILGATLDKVADAIEAFNTELERNDPSSEEADEGSNDGDEKQDDVEEEEEEIIVEPTEEEAIVEPEASADADVGTPGDAELIVEGEDEEPAPAASAKDEDDDSTASWVIPEENQEQFARAAEVIGSALFNSGMMQSSADNTADSGVAEEGAASSSSSSGTSFSSVGSVPTSVPSVISRSVTSNVTAAQTERWALQLQQLHELGFYDDALLIEVIEKLNAANIGVDSSDEVTVEQVVDELLKDKK